MNKMRSGQYKSRNLPNDFKVLDQVKSKPVAMLIVMIVVGIMLVFEDKYFFMGIVILGFSLYHLFFSKNVNVVEFGDDYAVFYKDEKKEECYVIYYNEVKEYHYKVKRFDTDTVTFQMKDGKSVVLKSIDKKTVNKNLEKHGIKGNAS